MAAVVLCRHTALMRYRLMAVRHADGHGQCLNPRSNNKPTLISFELSFITFDQCAVGRLLDTATVVRWRLRRRRPRGREQAAGEVGRGALQAHGGGTLQAHGGGAPPLATVDDGLYCLSIENLDVTDYNSATDYCQSV